MKGNFWHKLFRNGYNASYPKGSAARSNGNLAKNDAYSSRTKLNRFLEMLLMEEDSV